MDQRSYWGANLDPDNLGREAEQALLDYDSELPFHLVPDQVDALARLQPLAGRLTLDLGAGLGMNARHMASLGARVVAADLAPGRLRVVARLPIPHGDAVSASGKVMCVACRAEALPFRAGTFDRQYSKSVLIHTDLPCAAAELARTLKPDGAAAFIEPLTGNPFANLYRRFLGPAEWRTITRYFTDREVRTLAAPFGVRPDVRRYYFTAFLAFFWQFGWRARPPFRVCLAATNALDSLLMRAVPALGRWAWFAVIGVRR